jgi:hypothetical protein
MVELLNLCQDYVTIGLGHDLFGLNLLEWIEPALRPQASAIATILILEVPSRDSREFGGPLIISREDLR